MNHVVLLALALFAGSACAAILFQEDFENENLVARGFIDNAKWGEDKSLSIAGTPPKSRRTPASPA